MRAFLFFAALTLVVAWNLSADVIVTTNGNRIEGTIVDESADAYQLQTQFSTMTLPKSMVKSVERTAQSTSSRIPPLSRTVEAVKSQRWARSLEQIPATVIDNGVMKDVPYQSYVIGNDCEVNVYGDPENPCAVEIGLYRRMLTDVGGRQNCIDLIAGILPDRTDSAILKALVRAGDKATRRDVTFEITPETAPDAYGGWWVSIYNEVELEKSRATPKEMADLAVEREIAPAIASPTAAAPQAIQQVAAVSNGDSWSPAELKRRSPRYAPSPTTQRYEPRPPAYEAPSDSSGRVYVKGYYRKNGTYVRPHTRRK